MISVKNIVKKYQDKSVLKNVTLDLPKNKMIAFIGSNGAGKSTLLNIIGRTIVKNDGNVIIDDKVLEYWKSRDLAKRMAILNQSNHLNIRLTVRELVSFGRYPHSQGHLTDVDIAKIDETLAYVNMTDLQDRFLDQLSGGQRQLAYIAMVIAQNTEYLFLDEPLNNLDMRHSVQIMQILQDLVQNHGKTVMVVIHDINFVSCYADYIFALKDGQLVEAGPTSDIINCRVLESIYGIDMKIENYDGKKICLYYA